MGHVRHAPGEDAERALDATATELGRGDMFDFHIPRDVHGARSTTDAYTDPDTDTEAESEHRAHRLINNGKNNDHATAARFSAYNVQCVH